jgi:hypothetical protein
VPVKCNSSPATTKPSPTSTPCTKVRHIGSWTFIPEPLCRVYWDFLFVLSPSFSSISLLCNPLYKLYLPLSLPRLVHSACCHAGPHSPLVLPTPHLNHLLLLILLPSTFSPCPQSLPPLILLPPFSPLSYVSSLLSLLALSPFSPKVSSPME